MVSTYVYIIAHGDAAVKIGTARRPQARLRDLQIGSHHPLTLEHTVEYDRATAFKVERAAHKLLRTSRVSGEWFSASVEKAKKTIQAAEYIVKNSAPPQSSCQSKKALDFSPQCAETEKMQLERF